MTFRFFEKTSVHVQDHATGRKCGTRTDRLADGWVDRQAYKRTRITKSRFHFVELKDVKINACYKHVKLRWMNII